MTIRSLVLIVARGTVDTNVKTIVQCIACLDRPSDIGLVNGAK